MNIGDRIRTARKAAGLTQEDVARRAGVRLSAIARLERGESRDPHYSTLVGIARAVGMPVESLIKEEEPAVPKAQAPGTSGQQRKAEELADVPDSMGELLELCGARTRHLADKDLAATMNDASLEVARQIAREVLVEYRAVVEQLARLEERFPHAGTKIAGLLGQVVQQLIMARFALRVRTGARLVRIEPTAPTQSSEAVPEIEELDRVLAVA